MHPCDSNGTGLLKASAQFPLDISPCAFPFDDFALYLFALSTLL